MSIEIEAKDVQVGDWAWHNDGYDPREVSRVERYHLGLWISEDVEAWPCPIKNYTFTRA